MTALPWYLFKGGYIHCWALNIESPANHLEIFITLLERRRAKHSLKRWDSSL